MHSALAAVPRLVLRVIVSRRWHGGLPSASFQLRATLALRSVLRAAAPRVGFSHRSPETKREQRSQTFIGLSERAARAAFQPILDAVNAANQATPPVPKTSDTVAKAVVEWREHVAASLKPSTTVRWNLI